LHSVQNGVGRDLLENLAALGAALVVAAEPLEHHAGRLALVGARRVLRPDGLVQRVVLGDLVGAGRAEETDSWYMDGGREVEQPGIGRHNQITFGDQRAELPDRNPDDLPARHVRDGAERP